MGETVGIGMGGGGSMATAVPQEPGSEGVDVAQLRVPPDCLPDNFEVQLQSRSWFTVVLTCAGLALAATLIFTNLLEWADVPTVSETGLSSSEAESSIVQLKCLSTLGCTIQESYTDPICSLYDQTVELLNGQEA